MGLWSLTNTSNQAKSGHDHCKRPNFVSCSRYLNITPQDSDYVFVYIRPRAFRNYLKHDLPKPSSTNKACKLISAQETSANGVMAYAMEGVTDILNDAAGPGSTAIDVKIKMAQQGQKRWHRQPCQTRLLNTILTSTVARLTPST